MALEFLRHKTSANGGIETRPKAVRAWLGQLPLADPAACAHRLVEALEVTLAAKRLEATRLALAEIYRDTVRACLPALAAEYGGRPLPLPRQARQAQAAARSLAAALAALYKAAFGELAAGDPDKNRSSLATAAARQLECLAWVLDVCYRAYAPLPAGLWSEIHQAYWRALRQEVAALPLAATGLEPPTVAAAYKRVLLLAVADPYRLTAGQLDAVAAYLARRAHLAELALASAQAEGPGLFLVRLDDDRPPRPLARFEGTVDARTDLLLNTLPFVRRLHDELEAIEAGKPPADLPESVRDLRWRSLMVRLGALWGLGPKRSFTRLVAGTAVEVCVGLRALHRALGGESGVGAVAGDDMAGMAVDAQGGPTLWQVENESAGGLRLSRALDAGERVRVGDLLGLKLAGESWQVALVRWVRTELDANGAERVVLGVELVAPTARPAALKPTLGPQAGQVLPVLWLPEVRKLDAPARLVAGRGVFAPEREFELTGVEGAHLGRAGRLMEQTEVYEVFTFVPNSAW